MGNIPLLDLDDRSTRSRRRLQDPDECVSHLPPNTPEIMTANQSLERSYDNVIVDNNSINLGLTLVAIIPAFCVIYFVYNRLSKINREDPAAAATPYAVRASLV